MRFEGTTQKYGNGHVGDGQRAPDPEGLISRVDNKTAKSTLDQSAKRSQDQNEGVPGLNAAKVGAGDRQEKAKWRKGGLGRANCPGKDTKKTRPEGGRTWNLGLRSPLEAGQSQNTGGGVPDIKDDLDLFSKKWQGRVKLKHSRE